MRSFASSCSARSVSEASAKTGGRSSRMEPLSFKQMARERFAASSNIGALISDLRKYLIHCAGIFSGTRRLAAAEARVAHDRAPFVFRRRGDFRREVAARFLDGRCFRVCYAI